MATGLMDSRYAYASARTKTREASLLSETQRERLYGAKTIPETFAALSDTFVAPYLTEHEHTPLGPTLENVVTDAKKLLDQIAPDPELLHILWLEYDFANLRTIIKGKRAQWSDEDIVSACFESGVYALHHLLAAYADGTLARLNTHFARAAESADSAQRIFDIDLATNSAYFAAIKEITQRKRNAFADEFVTLLIDLFNIKMALRAEKLGDDNIPRLVIPHGRFRSGGLETAQQALDALAELGGEAYWREAVEEYTERGDFSLIEKASDELVLRFLKERSYSIFSPVPLFTYFIKIKQNVQLIHGVVTEKEAGLPEGAIRHIFRTPN